MSETSLALTKPPASTEALSVFGNMAHFESAQRMAKALSTSAMVPETYRGEQNIGSCLIALEMANRIGANVLSVCQNLYVVHGKPAWSSQFLIACVNASGRFSPLRYRMTGNKADDTYGCIAWATDKTGEKLESPEITIAIAKAEGWFQKSGSKWKTLPELMLRYRCATLFARLYAPEITLGLHSDDEVVDIVEVAPVVTAPTFVPSEKKPKEKAKPIVEATIVEPKPAAQEPDLTKEPTKQPEPANSPADELPLESPEPDPLDGPAQPPSMTALIDAMTKMEVSVDQLIKFAATRNLLIDSAHGKELNTLGLAAIKPDKLEAITKNILANGATLKAIKGVA